ncbi:MAG: hypothetical protein NZ750_03105 [Anaerolineae bacterium]|nr:hypothetical protein [Anaerolineae bacterium]MDW8170955.1 hypothetical protein [Anaerolineae bacterium]
MMKTKTMAALLLLLSACDQQTMDDRPSGVACETPPPAQVLVDGWRWRPDPEDEGLAQAWQELRQLSDDWRPIVGGVAWELADSAYANYDGVAWYWLELVVPEHDAYLYIGDADDRATVWLNGREVARIDAENPDVVLHLQAWGGVGEAVRLMARVEDDGVYGGFKTPLRLGWTAESAVPPERRAERWARANPNWIMPRWTRGGPLAWTMTGLSAGKDESLVTIDGGVAPYARAPITQIWLYDPQTKQVQSPDIRFSLIRNAPMPQWEGQVGGAALRQVAYVDSDDRALRWRVWVDLRQTSERELLLVLRPLGAGREVRGVYQVSASRAERLWVNSAPYLAAARQPSAVRVGRLGEVMSAALSSQAPSSARLDCEPDGLGAAIMRYRLSGGREHVLDFAMPSQPGADFPSLEVDAGRRLEATAAHWRGLVERVGLRIPDERLQAAYEASLGYLLLASDPDGPHPGPLAHDAVWVRDAAYMGLALLMTGHDEVARSYLEAIFDEQEESGRVPPIQGPNIPWSDDEWDSQGQSIFLAMAVYRYTQDEEILRRWYPHMRQAALFIRQLRKTYAQSGDRRLRGLLPPSLSAEDLGPRQHHYYWDNLWSVVGLREAGEAARLLGRVEDSAWMQAEAEALQQAIRDSVAEVMRDQAQMYIPGSVEVLDSSAMARGTVPALWPYRVFSVDDELIRKSFQIYYDRWIAPYGGGYLHREAQFWTYGGVELAHAYLRLGDGAVLHQILGWTLANQTLPGTYAWAEQVSPVHKGFTGGDMPHAWMAASLIALIREMLVTAWGEEEGTLELFRQAPSWWFEEGRKIELSDAPTPYGPLTLRTESAIRLVDGQRQGQLMLELGGAKPPEGFVWRVPGARLVDGPEGTQIWDDQVRIPSVGGRIILDFASF